MKIFVSTSYSAKINYGTGDVFPEHKQWLEEILTTIEHAGHQPLCALRDDNYNINNADPDQAYLLDRASIDASDVVFVLLDDQISAGVQLEIGLAAGLGKKIILAHLPEHKLTYLNASMVSAGAASELELPLTADKLDQNIS
jgi:nucleoside 2-deoxyribosyltransferase